MLDSQNELSVKSLIGALTEIHNPLSFLYGMVLEREGYQMPSFVLNDLLLHNLSVHHDKEEK